MQVGADRLMAAAESCLADAPVALDPVALERDALDSDVLAAQAGDPLAFEALVVRYERAMLRFAYRMLGNLEEAKDASQEVFVRLHRYLHRLDAARDPSPWLHQMMRNVCHDLLSRRGRFHAVSLDEDPEPLHPDPHTPDPHEQLDRVRQQARLQQALTQLPERERAALILRDVEGHSAAEAARLLGSSEVTVRSQASRARSRLRQILEVWR